MTTELRGLIYHVVIITFKMHYKATGMTVSISAKLLFLCLVMTPAKAYRILAYEPSVGHSHWNVMSAVLESLVDAGHEVVCVTIHPATDHLATHVNYTHVDISYIDGNSTARDKDFTQVMRVFASKTLMIQYATDRNQRMCTLLSGMPAMRDILDGRRFDAIVMESLFSACQSSSLLFGRLGLPTMYVVPSSPVNWMPTSMGSSDHPSYIGTLLTGHPTPGTFVQRLSNAVDYAHTNLVRWYTDSETRSGDVHRRQGPTDRNTMMFINTHHSVEPARPLGPNILEIGGIHLRRPPRPLPLDIKDTMDKNNEYGVIVFTFGSLIAISSLPENILDALKLAFSQLPQTILWKYENDHMPNKPKNVVLYKWLPQRDILHHPNVKIFMSHGGSSGLYEVVEAGVPVLGVPLFYDQPRNIQNLVDLGMGLSLDINNMTENTISSAINRLLTDQSFTENAKRVSSLFRDRPMTPADSVVYWTEYLIRHGTEANIRPLSADASWTSHFMIDLCAALVVAIFSLYFCIRIIIHMKSRKLKPLCTN